MAAVFYALMQGLMEVVVRVYFRRLVIFGRDRFPEHDAVLVVANHPAAWTDVLVLDVALRRKLSFVAHERLFRPWVRGFWMRLYSALPVLYRHEDPRSVARNRETFDRCHELFRRREAIAVFPEGVSGDDTGLQPLKTGAARLLLEHMAAGDEPPALIPVGIHYEDRTAFRTGVNVAVGAPIPLAGRTGLPRDPDEAAHALTGEMARAIETALAAAAAHVRDDEAVAPPPAHARILAALERLLAAVGLLLHAVPVLAIEWVARRFAGEPQQLSFGRILSGVVLVPLWYGGLVALTWALGGGAWFLLPASAPVLGALACREIDRRSP